MSLLAAACVLQLMRLVACCSPGQVPGPVPTATGGTAGGGAQGAAPQPQPAAANTPNLRASLAGSADFDGHIKNVPLNSPHDYIQRSSDLDCADWVDCRWRNEPDGPGRDKLGWGRGRGEWDTIRGNIGFGTTAKAAGRWLITGTGEKSAPDVNGMLVSDPVPCQLGDGQVQLRYWTTPGARIRVCTRRPETGTQYIYCSPYVSDGDPGPAGFNVPGPIEDEFELVVEASGFTFDQFGVKGGGVIVDDLTYSTGSVTDGCAQRARTTTQEPQQQRDTTANRVTTTEPVRRRGQRDPACDSLACNFADDGKYMVADGPNPTPLETRPFTIDGDKILKFCYYRPAALSNLVIRASRGGRTEQLFSSPDFSLQHQHKWNCDQLLLSRGSYDSLKYIASGLTSNYASMAVDSVELFDLAQPATPVC